jgi:hypothetical protein
MVKSIGAQWVIINGPCLELSGTQWNDRPEFCPILSQVVEPDVTLPGAWNRVAIQAEIDRMRVFERRMKRGTDADGTAKTEAMRAVVRHARSDPNAGARSRRGD